MKKQATISIHLFLLIFITLAPAFTNAEEEMKLVYFYDFEPFSWIDSNHQMQGVLIDILTESLNKRMGIKISHKGYPWARAQKYVKFGNADAFATVPTSERKTYTQISDEPIITTTFTIFTSKSNPKIEKLKMITSIQVLSNYSNIHYIGSGWAKKNLSTKHIYWVPTLSKALSLLANERYDVFIDASQVIRYNIVKMGFKDKIIELPNILATDTFNLCIGKTSPYLKILPKFNKTIQIMKKDGSLQKIYKKHHILKP